MVVDASLEKSLKAVDAATKTLPSQQIDLPGMTMKKPQTIARGPPL